MNTNRMSNNTEIIKNYFFENIKNLNPDERRKFLTHLQTSKPYYLYSADNFKMVFEKIIEITEQFVENNNDELYINSFDEHITNLINGKSALVLIIASFFKDKTNKNIVSMFNKSEWLFNKIQ